MPIMFYEKQGFIFFNIFRRAVAPALAGSVRDAHSFFFLSICLASKHKIIHFFFRNDTLEWFCYCVIWPREPTKLIKSRGVHRGRKCISAQTVSIGISTNKARRIFHWQDLANIFHCELRRSARFGVSTPTYHWKEKIFNDIQHWSNLLFT